MGGLVGGAFATGMDGAEVETFITSIDWDTLFQSASFEHKNIRRKADARAYPSRLEFGLRGGIVPPTSLNNGESVELLLARIAAPYYEIKSFDELPTPFRTVAVDLLTAQPVVLQNGSFADALRATMSLPLAFPPVDLDGRLLVDGGAMNNIPADVVRTMGAAHVIAINVGNLADREGINSTMFGVASETMDAMMRSSTRRAIAGADVVINVPLEEYGSLDWRRAKSLVDEGYRAAEAMRDQLLPLALPEAEFKAWRRGRQARRRTTIPVPAFVQLDGFGASDARRLEALLAHHVGGPLDTATLERDIATMSGLDRYESVTWSMMNDVRAAPDSQPRQVLHAAVHDARRCARERHLDRLPSGADGALSGVRHDRFGIGGPHRRHRRVRSRDRHAALSSDWRLTAVRVVRDGRWPDDVQSHRADVVIARYRQVIPRIGGSFGANIGARSDVRLGFYAARPSASIERGIPIFPSGAARKPGWSWCGGSTRRTVRSPVEERSSTIRVEHIFDSPPLTTEAPSPYDVKTTQLSGTADQFWSLGSKPRIFVYGGLGTSFNSQPLPTDQFALGAPFRMGAYDLAELRGAHYYVATGGYLRQIGRLPDFVGGPIFSGAWLENGDAVNDWREARWRTNGGAGLVLDTLLGPVIIGGSWGFDGHWRTYLSVGRTFR